MVRNRLESCGVGKQKRGGENFVRAGVAAKALTEHALCHVLSPATSGPPPSSLDARKPILYP